jgi:hypothetical protein
LRGSISASKKVGQEVNTLLSHHQNAGQNYDIKVATRSFKNMAQFRYLGMTITNQNLIQEEIKRRLNSANARIFGPKGDEVTGGWRKTL